MRREKAEFCSCPDFIYKSGRCARCGNWIDDPKEYSKSKRNKFEFRHVAAGECNCVNSNYDLDRICQICFCKEKASEPKVFFKGIESDVIDDVKSSEKKPKKIHGKPSLTNLIGISLTLSLLLILYLNNRGTFEFVSENVMKPNTSSSATEIARELLIRLNKESETEWLEDPAVDLTGSNSLAVYLESGGDNCAIWVFPNEVTARSALDNQILDFPGYEIYVGEDSTSNLGIVALSPFSGAACEFVIAKVLGWGK